MENKKVNDGYKLYTSILKFNKYSRSYILCSIPKVHNDIKIHYQDELYNLSKNIFYATYNKGNIRMKYLTDIQVSISMIDMLLTEIKNLKCIKIDKINNSINLLFIIKNIIYGWKFNEESKRNKKYL